MATLPNLTVEQLAQAFKDLSLKEKTRLLNLLPEEWFGAKGFNLSKEQEAALDLATQKEADGNSVFHSWSEVEHFVRTRNNA